MAVVWVALFAVYMILPNVRVAPGSALFGAAVSAILWQGALILYVQLQMGVAGYNALYSALGAVPIFLVWIYVSWVILLIGAHVAASHQGHRALRLRLDAARADEALKEDLAILVAARVAREFLFEGRHPTEASLAAALAVPEPLVHEVVDALVRRGVLVRTVGGRQHGCAPSRDPDAIRLRDIQDALREDERAEQLRGNLRRLFPAELGQLLRGLDEETRRSDHNVTLRDLATMARGSDSAQPRIDSESQPQVH